MLTSILSTKLYIPEMRPNLVIRERLIEKLTAGINSNMKLTLISAPAGYGKTTLALELIRKTGFKSSWISFDEGDNDPVRFISYFIASLKKAGIQIGSDTEGLAQDFNPSSVHVLMSMIINDIANFTDRLLLVLDDFHLIYSEQVSGAVKFFIEHQPPNFHLIIATREDPKLPLSRLRVRGELNEMRIDDLRFCGEETENFFKKAMDLSLDHETVEAFNLRTEGWIAGLQLAGLSLKGCRDEDIKSFVREFSGTHRYIIDYLVDEVLERQTSGIRDFLCKTSILERMNGELCDAVAERNDSKMLLHELEQTNLFIIPLDEKREWYRYHHLFADSIRTELSKEEEQMLHKRAAFWLEENGFKQDAVKHAFLSGDMDMAVKFVENCTEQLFKDAQLMTLVKWLDMLPGDMIKNNEILSVRKAWALIIVGRVSDAVEYINSLGEDFIKNTTPQNKGLYLSFQARILLNSKPDDSEMLAGEALKFLEPWDPIARISNMNTLGSAQASRGRLMEANNTLISAYEEGLKLGYSFVTTLSLLSLGTNLNQLGRRREAIEQYVKYIEGMTLKFIRPLPYIGIIYVGLSMLYYEGNELEEAKSYLSKGLDLCGSISYIWGIIGEVWTALIDFAMGEGKVSVDIVKKAYAAAQRTGNPRDMIICIDALESMLLRQEDIAGIAKYKENIKNLMETSSIEIYEQAGISYAKIMVNEKRADEAVDILNELEKKFNESQKIRRLITVHILQAEAFYLEGDLEKSNIHIDAAIKLAGENGYIRPFLDEGPAAAEILKGRKSAKGEFENELRKYLGFKTEESISSGGYELTEHKASLMDDEMEYIEQLSAREKDILRLIGRGMSNSDIAKELFISTNTTQWHISHIYSKLGVKSRTQAIIKAKELGIF